MTCGRLRLRCIDAQYSITLLHAMLLPRATAYRCTAQYSTAVPHAAASGLNVSVYSTVQRCCTTCCCLRPYRISVQHSPHAAASDLIVSVYSTVQPCCTTCCCLGPRCIDVRYSTALLYHMLLPWASSYRCTVQYSTDVPHAVALGLVVSVYNTVQHCCATCCCLRPRRIDVQYSAALLYDMWSPQASLY